MLAPEIFAQLKELAPAGGWPVTVSGWVTLIGVTLTAGLLLWDRIRGTGKTSAEIKRDIAEVTKGVNELKVEMQGQDQVLDTVLKDVRELKYELKGVDGDNGLKEVIRYHTQQLTEIHKRNAKMDVLAAIFKQGLHDYGGPERRESMRRALDLIEKSPED